LSFSCHCLMVFFSSLLPRRTVSAAPCPRKRASPRTATIFCVDTFFILYIFILKIHNRHGNIPSSCYHHLPLPYSDRSSNFEDKINVSRNLHLSIFAKRIPPFSCCSFAILWLFIFRDITYVMLGLISYILHFTVAGISIWLNLFVTTNISVLQ